VEFLRRARLKNPHAAFLAHATALESEIVGQVLKYGATDCIYTPASLPEISAIIERAVLGGRFSISQEIFAILNTDSLRERAEHLHNVLSHPIAPSSDMLDALVAGLDKRESTSNLHSLRVQQLCTVLAQRCGYDAQRIPQFAQAALLHDVGKMAIPASILMKPAKLTPQEFDIVKQHTSFGYQVLSRVPHLRAAADLALSHHERIDGTGYPMKLKGHEIPLEARIFTIADTADVITGGRPYCGVRSMAQARVEIAECSGSQFDPDIVDVFLTISDDEWYATHQAVNRRYQALQPYFNPAPSNSPLQELAQ
jgi:HD-GYP domain-containing protein (c-di-GMP phosphodiesterase class II)